MATKTYEEILKRAQDELSHDEQQRLAEVLAQRAGWKNGGPRKITDLEGLGADIWKGTDADEYVANERDSWDG